MSQNFDTSTFGNAYKDVRAYPKTGARGEDGIPSVATLARIAGAEMFGDEHFETPLTGESRNVLCGLLAAVEDDSGFEELMLSDRKNSEMREDAEDAILARYPSAEAVGFATGSLNRSGAGLAALAELEGIDVIEATRDRLEGEVNPLAGD